MVSSQTEHVRGCHRGRNGSARTIARGIGERLCGSGRMALQGLFNTLSACTFQVVLFLCELSDHHCDDTFENVLLPSLPTPTRAVLLIIRGLSGQTVSFPQSQDRRTKVRPSGKQLLGYVPVWPPNPVAAVQPSVAALPHSLRRELAVLVYLVKRIERG